MVKGGICYLQKCSENASLDVVLSHVILNLVDVLKHLCLRHLFYKNDVGNASTGLHFPINWAFC